MLKKVYTETELIDTFNLKRIVKPITPRMKVWLSAPEPVFTPFEQHVFDEKYAEALDNIVAWNEEKLKMHLITHILGLGHLRDTQKYILLYEKPLKHTINGIPLSVQTDFMIAKGRLDIYKEPYFHFQEYKPEKNPSGDAMAQLLQAMMIGQEKNNNGKPIYGCEIIGRTWTFVIMEGQSYCISKKFDAIDKQELLKIIAVLRKFKEILETELLES